MSYGYQQYGGGLMGLQPGFNALAQGAGQLVGNRLDPTVRQQLFQYPEDFWNYDRGGFIPGTPGMLTRNIEASDITRGMNPADVPLGKNGLPLAGAAPPGDVTFNTIDRGNPIMNFLQQMLMSPAQQSQQAQPQAGPAAYTGLAAAPPQPPMPYLNQAPPSYAPAFGGAQGTPPTAGDIYQSPGFQAFMSRMLEQPMNVGAQQFKQGGEVTARSKEGGVKALIDLIRAEQNPEEVPAVLHEGEVVLTQETVAALGGPEAVESLNHLAQQPNAAGQALMQNAQDRHSAPPMMPPYMGRQGMVPQEPRPSTQQAPEFGRIDPSLLGQQLLTSPDNPAQNQRYDTSLMAQDNVPNITNAPGTRTSPTDPAVVEWTETQKTRLEEAKAQGVFAGTNGTQHLITDEDPGEGWAPLNERNPLGFGYTHYVKQASTPQTINEGPQPTTVTQTVQGDPMQIGPPESTGPVSPVSYTLEGGGPPVAPEEAAILEMPATPFRQHQQTLGLDPEYMANASPEEVMMYMRNVAENRAPNPVLWNQRQQMDPNQMPQNDQLFGQMAQQYAQTAMTPEMIRELQQANAFNLETQPDRASILASQAKTAAAGAEVDENVVQARIDALKAESGYTEARTEIAKLEAEFMTLSQDDRLTELAQAVERGGYTNDFFEELQRANLKNIDAQTGLYLAQAGAYQQEIASYDSIFADPAKYSELLQDAATVRLAYVNSIRAQNEHFLNVLESGNLGGREKELLEGNIQRNTMIMDWMNNPGTAEAVTWESFLAENGGANRVKNQFGIESAEDLEQIKNLAINALSATDLTGQVAGGFDPNSIMNTPTSGMSAGGDEMFLYAMMNNIPPEQLMEMLASAQQGQ